jgi:hypothetical protein
MVEDDRPSRFRFRIRALVILVAILALLLVVVMQQVQIQRQQVQIRQMKQQIDSHLKEKDALTTIIRELRDAVDRHR